jgi:hypothetical protein
MENVKIYQLVKVGMTLWVKCVIIFQGKSLEIGPVVILGWTRMGHLNGVKLYGSNIAITKDVEKHVENPARNAQVSAKLCNQVPSLPF